MKMTKKNKFQTSDIKAKRKKYAKIIEDAIEKRMAALEEYRKTPTKEFFEKKIADIEWDDQSAVMLSVYNPQTENLQFWGIKALPTDIQAMCLHALHEAYKADPAMCMVGISTLARQKILNDTYVESIEPEEIKDDE